MLLYVFDYPSLHLFSVIWQYNFAFRASLVKLAKMMHIIKKTLNTDGLIMHNNFFFFETQSMHI